eukprot:scaffold25196_cov135-Skeletonema_marinoi.AAC.4
MKREARLFNAMHEVFYSRCVGGGWPKPEEENSPSHFKFLAEAVGSKYCKMTCHKMGQEILMRDSICVRVFLLSSYLIQRFRFGSSLFP